MRMLSLCWKLFLFVFVISCSVTWNTAIALAASMAPADRRQLDSISRETGAHYSNGPSRDAALNDSHATISTPPPPPESGTSALPPSPPISNAPPPPVSGPGR